jgi:hypothetical protein
MIDLKKIYVVCRWSGLGHNQLTLKFPPLVIHSVITLLLNGHVRMITQAVMISHIFSLLHVLERCQTIGQREMDHAKCPLYILPSSLLLFSKPTLFLVFRLVDCLHKFDLERIDTIGEIVLFLIRVAIDHIGDIEVLPSASLENTRER